MISQDAADILTLLIALMMIGCVAVLCVPDRDASVAGWRTCRGCGRPLAPDEEHRH